MANMTLFILLLVFSKIITGDAVRNTILPKFPAILIFGDSTVDTGNNNYINTFIKANHLPYGKDFPQHISTGRFSNGKLIPDFIASMYGIKQFVPPFMNPNLSTDELVTGVCFASAGSGYDNATTSVSNAIPVLKQLDLFRNYTSKLESIVGIKHAKNIINKALVLVSAGTNDWILNYYNTPTRMKYSVAEYQTLLLNKTQAFTKVLYDLGCRSIIVAGVPPIGCLPLQMTLEFEIFNRKCLKQINSEAQSYNERLQKVLSQLQATLPASKVLYLDVYTPLFDMITNPKKYGFAEVKRGCCGTGTIEAANFSCNKLSPLCKNASEYMFFDSVHPTEATYKYMVESMAKGVLSQW